MASTSASRGKEEMGEKLRNKQADRERGFHSFTHNSDPALTVSHDTKHTKVRWRAFLKKGSSIESDNNGVVSPFPLNSLLLLPE